MSGYDEADEAVAPPKTSKMKWIVGGLVLLLLAGGGGGYAAVTTIAPAEDGHGDEEGGHGEEEGGHGEEEGGHGEEEGGHGAPPAEPEGPPVPKGKAILELDPFTLNLKGSGGARVLRMRVALMSSAKQGETVEAETARIRDAILTLGSDYTWTDLEGVDGKMHLHDELLERVNAFFSKPLVEELFFTDFVVQ